MNLWQYVILVRTIIKYIKYIMAKEYFGGLHQIYLFLFFKKPLALIWCKKKVVFLVLYSFIYVLYSVNTTTWRKKHQGPSSYTKRGSRRVFLISFKLSEYHKRWFINYSLMLFGLRKICNQEFFPREGFIKNLVALSRSSWGFHFKYFIK